MNCLKIVTTSVLALSLSASAFAADYSKWLKEASVVATPADKKVTKENTVEVQKSKLDDVKPEVNESVPLHAGFTKFSVGLGWSPGKAAQNIDLDVGALVFAGNTIITDNVGEFACFFRRPFLKFNKDLERYKDMKAAGAQAFNKALADKWASECPIWITPDDRSGEDDGEGSGPHSDDETITFDLKKLPPQADRIVIVVSDYNFTGFSTINEAHVRLTLKTMTARIPKIAQTAFFPTST